MSFFKKLLKRFQFKKKPKHEEIELSPNELKHWLEKKLETEMQQTNEKIKINTDIIHTQSELINADLKKLGEKGLVNKNVQERVLHLFNGNKAAHIQKTEKLLLDIKPPKDTEDYSNLERYAKKTKTTLNEYSASTHKSFLIVREFQKDDIDKIAMHLKQIDQAIEDITKSVAGERAETIKKTIQQIEEYQKKLGQQEQFQKKLDELEEEQKNLESQKHKIKKKREEIINSPKYKELKDVYEEKESIKNQQKALHTKIIENFSPINSALQKYERTAQDSNLIKKYIENPFETLKTDYQFKIVEILEKLKTSITNNEIELKDKKKEVALSAIEKLNKDYLTAIISQNNTLIESKKEIEDKINKNMTGSNLSELDYQIEHLENKTKKHKEETQAVADLADRFNRKETEKNLEKTLKEITGTTVRINSKKEMTETENEEEPEDDDKDDEDEKEDDDDGYEDDEDKDTEKEVKKLQPEKKEKENTHKKEKPHTIEEDFEELEKEAEKDE